MPRLPLRACRPLEPAYSQTRETSLWHMSWCPALIVKGLLSVGLGLSPFLWAGPRAGAGFSGVPRGLLGPCPSPFPFFSMWSWSHMSAGSSARVLTWEPEFGAAGLVWKDFGPGGALGRSSVV